MEKVSDKALEIYARDDTRSNDEASRVMARELIERRANDKNGLSVTAEQIGEYRTEYGPDLHIRFMLAAVTGLCSDSVNIGMEHSYIATSAKSVADACMVELAKGK